MRIFYQHGPGDSIRGLFVPFKLEVTNSLLKGSRFSPWQKKGTSRIARTMKDSPFWMVTPPKTSMTGWKINHLKMYFLLNMGMFQPVMLVFGGVEIPIDSNHQTWQYLPNTDPQILHQKLGFRAWRLRERCAFFQGRTQNITKKTTPCRVIFFESRNLFIYFFWAPPQKYPKVLTARFLLRSTILEWMVSKHEPIVYVDSCIPGKLTYPQKSHAGPWHNMISKVKTWFMCIHISHV